MLHIVSRVVPAPNRLVAGARDAKASFSACSIPAVALAENPMDFIERIFGISPDGGSGLFEVLLFLIPVAGILAIREWRKRSTRK